MNARGSLGVLVLLGATLLSAESAEAGGKYLADNVGACGSHTPRAADGEPDQSKYLKRAVMNIEPIQPVEKRHKTSPDLTPASRLFQRWKEEGLIKFLD